jgi:hypothetical protein
VFDGVSLLGVDEVGELDGILDKEHGSVVTDHVVVTVLGVEFDGKSSWVTVAVVCSTFSSNGRETQECWSTLTNLVEELSFSVFGNIVSDFEISMSSSTLGVDDSLGNTLTVEVGKLINQVEVLENDWAVRTCSHGV